MDSPGLVALPLVAWLASGLAAVALAPRSAASRAMAAAGALLTLSWLLEEPARTAHAGAAAWWVTACDVAFLLGLVGVVALLATYPDGELAGRRHLVVGVLAVLAVVGPVLRLLGDPLLPVPGTERSRRNPVALDGLAPLGDLGELVVLSEPLWVLLGVALLALRVRAGSPSTREVRPLLWTGALLAALLVVALAGSALGAPVPEPVLQPLFLGTLGAVPVVLLAGISQRIRALDAEVAASRARLVGAEDRARRAIERDLHDGVQQQLVALLPLVELADRQCRRDPERATTTLAELRQRVTTAVQELRETVSGIRPPVLADAGVVVALESTLARLPVSLRATGRRRRWAPEAEAAAYFLACEAVTNALKHAVGSTVIVRVHEGEKLEVEVVDDGPGTAHERPGGGLSGLRDRVESLGGEFSVTIDGGTRIRAMLPGSDAEG